MSDNNLFSISATKDFKFIEFKPKNIFKTFAKFIVKPFLDPSILPDLANSIEIGPSLERQAYNLIFNAFHSALFYGISPEQRQKLGNLPSKRGVLDNKSKDFADKNIKIEINTAFFENPQDFELIRAVRPFYQAWLVDNGLSLSESQELQRNLGFEFAHQLDILLKEDPTLEQKIKTRFAPTIATASRKNLAAEKDYRNKICAFYEQKVLGEPISLSAIYREPFFSLHQKSCKQTNIADFNQDGFATKISFKGSIHAYLDQRLLHEKCPLGLDSEKQRIIFLLGQPGQGKSSFCYHQVQRLANNPLLNQNLYFLKFKDFENPEELLSKPFDTISEELKNQNITFSDENTILFLDGLDELFIREGLSSNKLAGFYDKIEQRIAKKERLSIVITSRYHYLNLKEIGTSYTTILQLKGLTKTQQIEWLESYKDKAKECTLSKTDLEKIHSNPNLKHLKELVEQPILLHILAKANINIAANLTRTAIYDHLFTALIKRYWDKEKQLKTFQNLEQEDFKHWLGEIAYTIYSSPLEYIHRKDLENLDSSQDIADQIQGSSDSLEALGKLLMAFYFQNTKNAAADETKEKDAVEFLHKSLQEYLTADYLWRSLQEQLLDTNKKRKYIIADSLGILKLFADLFATQSLNDSVQLFLEEIITADADKKEKKAIAQRLQKALNDCLQHQFLYDYQAPTNNKAPFWQARDTAFAYWFFLALSDKTIPLIPDGIVPDYYLNLIEYFLQHKARACSFSVNLSHADLRYANLSHTNLSHADLRGANLSHAKLISTKLISTNLSFADLSFADLWKADLSFADLRYANLSFAKLSFAKLSNANLSFADLWKAKLEGTKVSTIDFFQRSNIQNAATLSKKYEVAPSPHYDSADTSRVAPCYLIKEREIKEGWFSNFF